MSEILDHAVEPLSLKWTISPPARVQRPLREADIRTLLDRLSAFTGKDDGDEWQPIDIISGV